MVSSVRSLDKMSGQVNKHNGENCLSSLSVSAELIINSGFWEYFKFICLYWWIYFFSVLIGSAFRCHITIFFWGGGLKSCYYCCCVGFEIKTGSSGRKRKWPVVTTLHLLPDEPVSNPTLFIFHVTNSAPTRSVNVELVVSCHFCFTKLLVHLSFHRTLYTSL